MPASKSLAALEPSRHDPVSPGSNAGADPRTFEVRGPYHSMRLATYVQDAKQDTGNESKHPFSPIVDGN